MVNLFVLVLVRGISIDCPNIINLALGLHMNIAQPTIMSKLQFDCCTAVTCVSQRVTELRWNTKGLSGSINGSLLTSGLKILDLSGNSLSGAIDKIIFPDGLQQIWLFSNQFTGSIPRIWPSGLLKLDVSDTQLSGDIPLFPLTLTYLALGYPGYQGTHFSGSVVLNQPIYVYLTSNWITDVEISDVSRIFNDPQNPCDISFNPLLGNPIVSQLPSFCLKNGLYSANLLPKTRSSFIPTISSLPFLISTLLSTLSTTATNIILPSTVKSSSSQILHSSSAFATILPSTVKFTTTTLNKNGYKTSTGTPSFLVSTLKMTNSISIDKTAGLTTQIASTLNLISKFTGYYESRSISTISLGPPTAKLPSIDNNTISSFSIALIVYAFVAFTLLCILVLIAGKIIKHPVIHSRFARKHSMATLNSVQTRNTVQTR